MTAAGNEQDIAFMARAIELAKANMGHTWPNPAVGCVIVKDGVVVAEAATAPSGRPHAEEQAVPEAGDAAKGATAYVTLEPCGARSSGRKSCSHFLIDAGITRVVIGAFDPSPFASGRGVERLRSAGLQVDAGVLENEALTLCEGFLHRLKTGRPMVRVSEDGTGFDARFAASARSDLAGELMRLGEAGYTRVWTTEGELADALRAQGLLTE